MANVNRIGVNLGWQVYYGESNFMQNMFDDPGFEPGEEGHLGFVSSPSSSGFSDSADYQHVTGFWNGASVSVRTGVSAGKAFTVGNYTAGGTYTCSPSCPTLNSGDVFAEVQVQTTSTLWPTTPWGASDSNESVVSAVPGPGVFDGRSSLAINVADGANHNIHYNWDNGGSVGGVCSDNVTLCTVANAATDCASPLNGTCTTAPEGGPWHPVVGAFKISFNALVTPISTGTPTINVSLTRSGGVNTSNSFALVNDGAWHQYSYNFTGTDTASSKGYLNFTLTANNGAAQTGATIYVDDAYLGRNESSPTGFRDEMVNTLQAMGVGSTRYMVPWVLDQDEIGYDGRGDCAPGATTVGGCDYLKGPSGNETGNTGWVYSAGDVAALADAVNAVPWYTIPNTFSDADLVTFTNKVCSAISAYGLSAVYVEQGNEDWNGVVGSVKLGGSQGEAYGALAGRNLSVMSKEAASECPSNAAKIHYIIGNQVCNDGVIVAGLKGASSAGFAVPNTSQYGTDDAPYMPESSSLLSEVGALLAQASSYAGYFMALPQTYFGSNGCVINQDMTAIGNRFMALYEMGPNGYGGAASNRAKVLESSWVSLCRLDGRGMDTGNSRANSDSEHVHSGTN